MTRLRKSDDPWVQELFSFMLQNPVGEYENVTISDRTFPLIKFSKQKNHFNAEVKLGRDSRRRLSYTMQGEVTENTHLNY